MKKGKNMINQKNDLNMITRKLETELLTFHFDGLEISEITTTTSWMKLHINVVFIKDDVQITKVLYKDYETGLWYYIKDNGMIISHKDTFNHTIKNLIDEMIYDCHIEIEEVEETKATEELEETKATEEAEETKATEEIPNVKKCSIAYCCPADRKHNKCGGTQTCRTTWERYKAIVNPEWHHVSLNTLADLDFDMLDEKRKTYLSAYRDLKQTLSYLRKCKTQDTYDTCFIRYTRRKNMLYDEDKISYAMWKYIERKLSMQNVESGVWASKCEDATGHHESRRYNKSRA